MEDTLHSNDQGNRKTRSWYRNNSVNVEEEVVEKRPNEKEIANLPIVKFYGEIVLASDDLEIANIAKNFLLQIDNYDGNFPLGFDMEWPFTFQTGPGKTALIQLCADKRLSYLLYVYNLNQLPKSLVELLSHKRTILCGVNIRNDIHKLARDFPGIEKDIILEKCIDSRGQANQVSSLRGWSMEKLVNYFFKMRIDKNKAVRNSQWHKFPYSEEQKIYAATDAFFNDNMARLVHLWNLGRKSYSDALHIQQIFAKNHLKQNNPIKDILLIVEHYPVFTIGIRTKDYTEEDEKRLIHLGAEFHRTNRGGLITFHGLGQLVAYPILNLKNFRPSVRWYVSTMEQTVISMCADFNIKAETSPHTGVWVNDRKICAIGIHGSQYITTHGLAINCNTDLKWFDHIIPCGIEGKGVTSLSKELNKNISIDDTLPYFISSFSKSFNCTLININDDKIKQVL